MKREKQDIRTRLAQGLPDVPRWLKTRYLLSSGRCRILAAGLEPLTAVVIGTDLPLISVIGLPVGEDLIEAVSGLDPRYELLAGRDNEMHVGGILQDWHRSPALLHRLSRENAFCEAGAEIRLLEKTDLTAAFGLPSGLKEELHQAVRFGQVAAAFIEGRPVSFCYAHAVTETLWDVSIDTLAEFRRQGYACQCALFMIRHMRNQGKEAVWGSLESNTASLRLADKLGFEPVDRIFVFRQLPPEDPWIDREEHEGL